MSLRHAAHSNAALHSCNATPSHTRHRAASRLCIFSFSHLLICAGVAVGQPPVVRTDAAPGPGDDAATDIQATVDQFRLDVGGPNNGDTFGSTGFGRREIDWDDVSAGWASPVALPANYYNQSRPRGVVLSGAAATTFQVSATGGGMSEFENFNADYPTAFATFSDGRLFSPIGDDQVVVAFFVPATNTPATVSGFGAVFVDVDFAGTTQIEYFDADGVLLLREDVPPASGDEGMSFLGVTFADPVVRWVRITCGTSTMFASGTLQDVSQGGAGDLVVLDDFIYGEPMPAQTTSGTPPSAGGSTSGGGSVSGGGSASCGAGVATFTPAIGMFLLFGVRFGGVRRW